MSRVLSPAAQAEMLSRREKWEAGQGLSPPEGELGAEFRKPPLQEAETAAAFPFLSRPSTARVGVLEEEVAALGAEVAALSAPLSALRARVGLLEAELEGVLARVDALAAAAARLEQVICSITPFGTAARSDREDGADSAMTAHAVALAVILR